MDEEFTLWLDKARESLDDAVYSLRSHRYSLTAFCRQQALEKILKAAVVKLKNARPRKIHDLLPLLRDSGLETPEEYVADIAKISKFYFLVRYPDISKKFFAPGDTANATLEKTKEIYKWIENKLKKS